MNLSCEKTRSPVLLEAEVHNQKPASFFMRCFSVPDGARITHRLMVVFCIGWLLLPIGFLSVRIASFRRLRGRYGKHTTLSLFSRWLESEVKSTSCTGFFSRRGTSGGTESMRRLYRRIRRSFRVTTRRTCRKKLPPLSSGLRRRCIASSFSDSCYWNRVSSVAAAGIRDHDGDAYCYRRRSGLGCTAGEFSRITQSALVTKRR